MKRILLISFLILFLGISLAILHIFVVSHCFKEKHNSTPDVSGTITFKGSCGNFTVEEVKRNE
jgi:hypothetical protein